MNIHPFLKDEHKHVNLSEAPDNIPDLSGEHTAAVLGVLHALGVDDSDALIWVWTEPPSSLPYCLKNRDYFSEV